MHDRTPRGSSQISHFIPRFRWTLDRHPPYHPDLAPSEVPKTEGSLKRRNNVIR